MATVIAHISDLHCGSVYFVPELAEAVVREVNELAPDILAITGDLTDMGFAHEYGLAHELLDGLDCRRRVIVPGNHDARNVGEVHFEEHFGARTSELLYEGVRVLAIDSSEPDLDNGKVGRMRHRWIEERFDNPAEFKIVCMHHHLVSVPGTGRERNIVDDAGDMLRSLQRTGVDLVLCGHKHVPNVWRLDDLFIVNAGTACSLRLRGRILPSYNIIEIHDNGRVKVIQRYPGSHEDVVADFRKVHQASCRWRPTFEGEAEDGER